MVFAVKKYCNLSPPLFLPAVSSLLTLPQVLCFNRDKDLRGETFMEYSTTAINSSKPRVEPVFVTSDFSGAQIEEKISDRFRIILFTEGNFSAEVNERIIQVISPAVLCLNEMTP